VTTEEKINSAIAARNPKGDRDRHAETFPMRALLSLAVLTLALIFEAGWIVKHQYDDLIGLVRTELRLQTLTGRVVHLDEVLTMSARMAAATGDLKWEARYRTFEPQLDSAINEAIALEPEAYNIASAAATDSANRALVQMENRAFAFVRGGEREKAKEILFSGEYEEQKTIYANGMKASNLAVELRTSAVLLKQQQRIRIVGAVALVVLIALIIVWARIVTLIRRYLQSTALARCALTEANEGLEWRVKERTAELLAGKVSLEEEMRRRENVELALRQSQKLESVGRLASGIAHEINTPIQYVSDNIHFVQNAMKDLTSLVEQYRVIYQLVLEGKPFLEAAARAAEAENAVDLPFLCQDVPRALESSLEGLGRVSVIVRSMKNFAHPDQKEKNAVDLNAAILSTLTIASSEYKYVAEVVTDLAELPPVTCYGGDLNQAILNLIVNSAHAIADVVEGTDVRGLITVRTRNLGDTVLISISDTGGGIKPEIRDHIFDPFFTTKEVGRGTGQGLAIARSVVVQKHGGELTFETVMGKGSTFFIRLPIGGCGQSEATTELREASPVSPRP
jgi:signal transduction histidine kinase